MLQKNWNQQLPIRLLGINLNGFANDCEPEQLSMFQLPEISHGKNVIDNVEKIENAIYIIRQKYGSSIINRAILMKKNNKK